MADGEVDTGNENLQSDTFSKEVNELNEAVSVKSRYSLDDESSHLVFTNPKKTIPSFEVDLQPEKIVEVFRLPDGSQSYRVRWKDTWVHEEFIETYQHLVDEFWANQKEDLPEDDQADKEMDFEDLNGDVSSDNDSYGTTMDALLLEEEEDEEEEEKKHQVGRDHFIEKSSPCDNRRVHSVWKISEKEHTVETEMDTSNGDVILPTDEQEAFEEAGNEVDEPNNPENEDETLNDNNVVLLEQTAGEMLGDPVIGEDIGELTDVVSLEDINGGGGGELNNNVHSITEIGNKKRKSSSLKRLGKLTAKRMRKLEEKKATKKKLVEDEEKENNEEKYGECLTPGGQDEIDADNNNGRLGETSGGLEHLMKKRRKREKFNYPHDKGPCTCDICGKVISNKYGLREHQTVVHFKNGKFECKICGKRVTNKRALNLHMTSHSNERRHVCGLCGSSHKTKGNLNYHVKTMHTMIKNFRCDICFKTFKVQAELKEHCFSVHANEGVITCIVCKKKLTTALSIYTHSVMHSGAREHECDICGYAFKTLTGLKEHKITHSVDKPVRQCPYCERRFFSRSQYNAHVMRHTADGSLITYKCPICDVKFQHKSSYNRHVIRHQPGGDLEFPKENPYLLLDESELPDGVCHKCRKHYSSKSGFYLHLKKCRDGIIQQFQCAYCERGCSNRSSLKRHIQRRHKSVKQEGEVVGGVDASQQASVLSSQDGIQYHGTYFDHGYGNQITTVDVSQLSAVDVQLLLDTAAAQNDNHGAATHMLGNVAQLTQGGDAATQNLHILTENEAAQFAAQLTQHGVIVRSTDLSRDQDQHLIVGTTQIDGHTSQLLVSERQAAQLLADAQLDHGSTALTLQTSDSNDILSEANVLQFNNRTAVIQIQHNDGMTTQQVLTLPEQTLQEQVTAHLEGQNLQDIDDENNVRVTELQRSSNVQVTELQRSSDIKMEHVTELQRSSVQVTELQRSSDIKMERVSELQRSSVQVEELQRSSNIKMECENNEVQQYIEEEQIVSSLSENDVEHAYQTISM